RRPPRATRRRCAPRTTARSRRGRSSRARTEHAVRGRDRRGGDEALEQAIVRVALGRELGMPLHADRERMMRALDRLDQTLAIARADAPGLAHARERLMMARDDVELAHAQVARELRVGNDG